MASSSFRQIIRFFLRFLLIILIILICDQVIGTILKRFYFSQESGVGYQTTYAMDSTVADVIILGSSRANHSYVPDIIEDSLHYTCYNAGRDGNFTLYNYAIFKAITRRYNPKLIIIDIRPEDLKYLIFQYERLSLLLPYFQTHPEIRSIIDLKGPFEKTKLISAIYPYNSLILQIAMGNLNYNKERMPNVKGYIPGYGIMKQEKLDTSKNYTCILDENQIQALKDISSTCKQKNIDLVFVFSPIWIIQDNFCNTIISEFCSDNDIRYLDMSNLPVFINNPDYFEDKTHLNNEGARLFSTMLINEIRRTD